MSKNSSKALALSACFLSPWFLYVHLEASFAAVVHLSVRILRAERQILYPILYPTVFPGMLKIDCIRVGFTLESDSSAHFSKMCLHS